MRSIDAVKSYLQVRANGWNHGEALKTSQMVFSAGGFSGLGGSSAGFYWPNTFRKLTDPWPERVGGLGTVDLEAFWRNSTVQACLRFIGWMSSTKVRLKVVEGEGEDAQEIKRHRLTRLIARPNDEFTPPELWQQTADDMWLWGRGNAYWRKIPDATGRPVQLWPIPAREIEPQWPQNGSEFISHYRRVVNGQEERLEREEVIHFRFGRDPQNQRKGWSPLMGGQSEAGILNEGASYRGAVLANHGVPGYALTPKDEQIAAGMDKGKVEDLQRLWLTKYGGQNRGALFIPNFSAELTRVGFSPQELDIRELMGWDADMICALFGLNSMVLGLPSGEGHRTYANMEQAYEAAFESNIVPTQSFIAAALELQLLPDFDDNPDHHVAFDYSQVPWLQEDQDKLWGRLDAAVKTGWVVPNEARARVNLKDAPWGEEPMPAAGTVPLPAPGETPAPESAGDAGATGKPLPPVPAVTNGNGRPAQPAALARR